MADCLKKNRIACILLLLSGMVNFMIFLLYHVFIEPFLYAELIALAAFLVMLVLDYAGECGRAEARERALTGITGNPGAFPKANSLAEEDCRAMIEALWQRLEALTTRERENRLDMQDYYTAWVHQIKTPIAAMKLQLAQDSEEHRALTAELFRIERYVDMALTYSRLDSDANDLVIREYDLDELIRAVIRKYASSFILSHLKLNYALPDGIWVITDSKWLESILEQLLSNALKYTQTGEISIALEEGNRLTVKDTGIGIAPEDLPRVFEKGYTGLNGRLNKASSGLGLYLAKTAADRLTIPLTVTSQVGKGSCFELNLEGKILQKGREEASR